MGQTNLTQTKGKKSGKKSAIDVIRNADWTPNIGYELYVQVMNTMCTIHVTILRFRFHNFYFLFTWKIKETKSHLWRWIAYAAPNRHRMIPLDKNCVNERKITIWLCLFSMLFLFLLHGFIWRWTLLSPNIRIARKKKCSVISTVISFSIVLYRSDVYVTTFFGYSGGDRERDRDREKIIIIIIVGQYLWDDFVGNEKETKWK